MWYEIGEIHSNVTLEIRIEMTGENAPFSWRQRIESIDRLARD
jgi:hypothetical protein